MYTLQLMLEDDDNEAVHDKASVKSQQIFSCECDSSLYLWVLQLFRYIRDLQTWLSPF